MIRSARSFVVPIAVLLPLAAQQGPPGPAPELKKLEPLVGNWKGNGKTNAPDGSSTQWDARGTFRWALDGHFLQQDFGVMFADGAPLMFRCYYGWDRENKRYVNAVATSAGEVALHEVTLQPDGSLLMLMVQNQKGERYVERSLLKVDGDKMLHSIDLLMGKGPSTTMLDCTFTRGEARFDGQFDVPGFRGATPHDAVTKLGRLAGACDVKGEMLMGAGTPPVKITGTDTFRSVFGGTVVHGHAEGEAEGMPGKRNPSGFLADFVFQLSKEELEGWRSQLVTSKPSLTRGLRWAPRSSPGHLRSA